MKQLLRLTICLGLLGCVFPRPTSALAGSRESAEPGLQEGIKVHGHWTFDVRDPDGTLAVHREFENALAFDGPLNLATALGRSATVGLWSLEIAFPSFPAGPCLNSGAPTFCYLTESADTIDFGQFVIPTLTINAPFRPDPNAGKLTLLGTFTVQNAGPIGIVGSFLGGCAPTQAPASCILPPSDGYHVLGFSAFSVATVAPILVTVGQLVQVSVVFSFS